MMSSIDIPAMLPSFTNLFATPTSFFKFGAPGQSRVLESPCVARGTAAFSVRLDIRDGHPAEISTELRVKGDSTPHGRNMPHRKTPLTAKG